MLSSSTRFPYHQGLQSRYYTDSESCRLLWYQNTGQFCRSVSSYIIEKGTRKLILFAAEPYFVISSPWSRSRRYVYVLIRLVFEFLIFHKGALLFSSQLLSAHFNMTSPVVVHKKYTDGTLCICWGNMRPTWSTSSAVRHLFQEWNGGTMG